MDTATYLAITLESCIILTVLIFSVILIYSRKLPLKVSKYVLLVYLNIGFIALFYLLINTGIVFIAEKLIFLFVPSTLSLGAVFYGLMSSYLYREKHSLDKWIVRVPVLFLLFFSILEIIHYSSYSPESIRFIRIFATENTLRYVYPVYNLALIIRAGYKIGVTEKENQQTFADVNVVDLIWIKISLAIYIFFFMGMVASNIDVVSPFVSELIFNSAILILVLYVGYFQIQRIVVYIKQVSSREGVVEKDTPVNDPKHQEKIRNIFVRIEELVTEKELFLNYDISVAFIAQELDVNMKYVSQAVNLGAGMNFNNYINAKRVYFSQQLLKEGGAEKLSIEGIANKSGFRSKSAFNRAFKRISGLTPTEYLRLS